MAHTTVQLRQSGGSVSMTLPAAFRHAAGLRAGSTVEVEYNETGMTVKPARSRITLADIIAAAPADADKQRAEGWDAMPSVGHEL